MLLNHILVEGCCSGKKGNVQTPCKGNRKMSYDCFDCSYFGIGTCPFEICITDSEGIARTEDEWIGFGGEMNPEDWELEKIYKEKWREICKRKIAEAYEEFMDYKKCMEK